MLHLLSTSFLHTPIHSLTHSDGSNWSPVEVSANICKFARSRWEKMSPMVDDITCIIVKLTSNTNSNSNLMLHNRHIYK